MIIFLWKQHCEMTSENKKKIPSQRWKSGESLMSAQTMMRAALITRRWIWRVSTQIQWRSASEGELTEPGSSSGSGTGKQPWFPPKHLSQRFSLTRLQPQSQPMCHLTSQASSPESFYKTDAFSVPEDLFSTFPKSVCHFKLKRETLGGQSWPNLGAVLV